MVHKPSFTLHPPSALLAFTLALALLPAHSETPAADVPKAPPSTSPAPAAAQDEGDPYPILVSDSDLIKFGSGALAIRASFDHLAEDFPELKDRVAHIAKAYDASPFAEAAAAIDQTLSTTKAGEWTRTKSHRDEMDLAIRQARFDTTDHREAFITGVEDFLKPEPPAGSVNEDAAEFQAILLSRAPRYTRDPLREFTDGWKRPFHTKGLPEALGEDLSVDLPASWSISKSVPGDPDMGIITSRSPEGGFPCMILVEDAPAKASDPAAFFADQEARKKETAFFGKVLTYESMTLAGQPGCKCTSDLGGGQRATSFMLIHGKHAITVGFLLKAAPGAPLEDRQKKYAPLFDAIAATLKIHG